MLDALKRSKRMVGQTQSLNCGDTLNVAVSREVVTF